MLILRFSSSSLFRSQKENQEGFGKFKEVKILKNCTGFANPGQTLYIMGSSGAGKTSLLNALSDRI